MPLHIDEQTKSYLTAKGKPLSIKLLEVNNCCAPTLQELMTVPGKPKDIDNYYEAYVGNIPVYIRKPLKLDDQIELKVSGFGIFKSVSAKLKRTGHMF